MTTLTYSVSVSRDGFVAGPSQSREHPLGVGGEALHEWLRNQASWRERHGMDGGVNDESSSVLEYGDDAGAIVMGRHMFGAFGGPWDETWCGWWGDDPPFHVPVFVLSHYPRTDLVMQGGTTFHFVTEGARVALERARHAAAGAPVQIAGGATTARQFLDRAMIDEVLLHQVDVDLGSGLRLFDTALDERYVEEWCVPALGVRHVLYRRVGPPEEGWSGG